MGRRNRPQRSGATLPEPVKPQRVRLLERYWALRYFLRGFVTVSTVLVTLAIWPFTPIFLYAHGHEKTGIVLGLGPVIIAICCMIGAMAEDF